MGRPVRIACAITLAGAACLLPACGGGDPSEGLISNVDKARAAQTLSTLTQGLIAVQTVAAESAGAAGAPALAAALQQRDASNRYTTGPPTDVGVIQVVGGGGGPVMLIGISAPPSAPRPPSYLAVWESGGTTLFYLGPQAPQYSPSPPAGAGWSASPPQA